jgi:hypothetical protein
MTQRFRTVHLGKLKSKLGSELVYTNANLISINQKKIMVFNGFYGPIPRLSFL